MCKMWHEGRTHPLDSRQKPLVCSSERCFGQVDQRGGLAGGWPVFRISLEYLSKGRDAVDYGLRHRDMGNAFYIGIDEISRRKGCVYHTQVYDLTEKRSLWSGKDRTSQSLEVFCDELGEERYEQVEAVCCDMWVPYVDVIKARLPNALLVFDKFLSRAKIFG